MGGSSNPIKKAKKKIKDASAQTIAEDVIAPQIFLGRKADQVFGTDVFEDVGEVTALATGQKFGSQLAGQIGRQLVDKPRAAKKEAARVAEETKKAQERQLAEASRQKKQSEAEKKAAKDLQRARATQARRSQKTGRSSTILTDTLGGTGGEAGSGRKTLLGL